MAAALCSTEENMKYTHIVWDFNGTILDDINIGIDSANALLKKRNKKLIESVDEYKNVFGFPICDYYNRIGFDFSEESFDKLSVEWVEEYMSRVDLAGVNRFFSEAISRLRELGTVQILLSATERGMLMNQIGTLGIENWFDMIYGLDNIQARSKKSLAERFLEDYPDAVPLFVGDTDHDAEVAASIGADCVLYSGGHQSASRLSELGLPVISSLLELESIVRLS